MPKPIRQALVTNDDGYESNGLWALARAVSEFAQNVTVVAPLLNQSAVSSGFTLRRELKWERIADPPAPGVEAWHVDGTPADCVMVASEKLVPDGIDLIVSGVNTGANVGNDILASGTVGAALAGSVRGMPALAFSLAMSEGHEAHWETAGRVASLVCRAHAEGGLPSPFLLNVNIPNIPYDELNGILVTRMGRSGFVRLEQVARDKAVIEKDTSFHTNPDTPPGTDLWALANEYISVSPLQANLTDHRLIDLLSQQLNSAFRRA